MENWGYMIHLFGWAGPVILLQWLIAGKILRRNEMAITAPTLISGTFFSFADFFAVKSGLWTFDPSQILGIKVGPLPIEEILFFYVVSLICAQTYVMLLPGRLRH